MVNTSLSNEATVDAHAATAEFGGGLDFSNVHAFNMGARLEDVASGLRYEGLEV